MTIRQYAKFDKTGFAYLILWSTRDQFPELSRIVVHPRMVFTCPPGTVLSPTRPLTPTSTTLDWVVSKPSFCYQVSVNNGICRRVSRSRIDSDKVVYCMTSDSLIMSKDIWYNVYGPFHSVLKEPAEKEAQITECTCLIYRTESRLILEDRVFGLVQAEV